MLRHAANTAQQPRLTEATQTFSGPTPPSRPSRFFRTRASGCATSKLEPELCQMSRPSLISIFNTFPKELFRVNNGPSVHLRIRRPHKYQHDVVPQNGLILPKALDPATYSGAWLNQILEWTGSNTNCPVQPQMARQCAPTPSTSNH